MGKYDDIINLPHHVSPTREPMPMEARAAQFAPFAALTGHNAAISETARLTDRKIELSEDELSALSRTLSQLHGMETQPTVTITHFLPDSTKPGGAYVDTTGTIKATDDYERTIVMDNGTRIPLDDIVNIRVKPI